MAGAEAHERASGRDPLEVLIVGAGFGGVAAAIELRRRGIGNLRILEKATDVGGTWFHNSYPAAACDVPSHLYSFSFAQRRDWSRVCSPQAEIHDYLRGVVSAHGLDELIDLATEVTSCEWDEQAYVWNVATAHGESYRSSALIIATGQLHQPARPRIEGAETFAGHSFHSAEWDHDYELADKRVAVIGTGASAVQFVPEVAERAKRLTVFQRSGNWFLPRKNRPYPRLAKLAYERLPGLQAYRRKYVFAYTESLTLAIRHPRTVGRLASLSSRAFMRAQLKNPEVRRSARPDYTFGCKRILFSSYFLPALQRENVELVTDPITRVTPEGVQSADGRTHELDCIIWATGFNTNDFMFPMEVLGRGGERLRSAWSGGAHAHLGMTVPGFPSMFVMYGPNTNTSGGSIIVYLEAQASYIRQALAEMLRRGASSVEVRPEVEVASDRALQARFAGTAWTECDSWYRNERGRIVANWPGYMREYLEQTREIDTDEYSFSEAPDRALTSA